MNNESLNKNRFLMTELYELTMANSLFVSGKNDEIAYFDVFFRKVPDKGGFAVFAGLSRIVDFIKNISFTESDLEYLRTLGLCEEFIDYLRNFEFQCDIWSVPEGTPIFPNEPVIKVRGPVVQAQFIETMILLTIKLM